MVRSLICLSVLVTFFLTVLPAIASADYDDDADDDSDDALYEEEMVEYTIDPDEVAALLGFGSLATSIVNIEHVWNGKGSTSGGLFAMALGGATMAFAFHDEYDVVAAVGTASFVVGLASLAMSLAKPAPMHGVVAAQPFVATITGETNVGIAASIRY
jgi:hypothetical protein